MTATTITINQARREINVASKAANLISLGYTFKAWEVNPENATVFGPNGQVYFVYAGTPDLPAACSCEGFRNHASCSHIAAWLDELASLFSAPGDAALLKVSQAAPCATSAMTASPEGAEMKEKNTAPAPDAQAILIGCNAALDLAPQVTRRETIATTTSAKGSTVDNIDKQNAPTIVSSASSGTVDALAAPTGSKPARVLLLDDEVISEPDTTAFLDAYRELSAPARRAAFTLLRAVNAANQTGAELDAPALLAIFTAALRAEGCDPLADAMEGGAL